MWPFDTNEQISGMCRSEPTELQSEQKINKLTLPFVARTHCTAQKNPTTTRTARTAAAAAIATRWSESKIDFIVMKMVLMMAGWHEMKLRQPPTYYQPDRASAPAQLNATNVWEPSGRRWGSTAEKPNLCTGEQMRVDDDGWCRQWGKVWRAILHVHIMLHSVGVHTATRGVLRLEL